MELDKTKDEISKVLTPDQARDFSQGFDVLWGRWLTFLPPDPPKPEWDAVVSLAEGFSRCGLKSWAMVRHPSPIVITGCCLGPGEGLP
jgi:hypothetical protein